ncbi:MAG: hypothetical protein F6K28_38610 [Microcoleus sp. SIO2G3]|nr:hypothetical protein [Microcoleus sp. SIO2G3]
MPTWMRFYFLYGCGDIEWCAAKVAARHCDTVPGALRDRAFETEAACLF